MDSERKVATPSRKDAEEPSSAISRDASASPASATRTVSSLSVALAPANASSVTSRPSASNARTTSLSTNMPPPTGTPAMMLCPAVTDRGWCSRRRETRGDGRSNTRLSTVPKPNTVAEKVSVSRVVAFRESSPENLSNRSSARSVKFESPPRATALRAPERITPECGT
ncbi:hypothetical protein T484DRAFT_1934539 [Baffinella frigidus]|nr:hypothetical protein T484DRAFT_1934539 [Cryptophyta sp. CCMP2293]